jgi:hypothetical protein
MTDNQWLGAIGRYASDGAKKTSRRVRFVGGAGELSGVLERRTSEQPERFAKMFLSFSKDVSDVYFESVIFGLRKAKLKVDLLLRVCHHAVARNAGLTGRYLVDLIGNHAEEDLPAELVKMVAAYAINDPDPAKDSWREKSRHGDFYYGGDIGTAALNCTRGRAALALGSLLRGNKERLPLMVDALSCLVRDQVLAVRVAAVEALLFVIGVDRALAVRLFLEAVGEAEEVLLSNNVERFIHWTQMTEFERIEPVMRRMAFSENSTIALAGARQLALASLGREELDPIVDECLRVGVAQRKGAAEVFAANVGKGPRAEHCQSMLGRFFNDESEDVRRVAVNSFRRIDEWSAQRRQWLLNSFAESRALNDDWWFAMHMISHSASQLPLAVLAVCEKWVRSRLDQQGAARPSDSGDMVTLVLRAYAQYRAPALRERCLDIVDGMFRIGVYGIDDAIESAAR